MRLRLHIEDSLILCGGRQVPDAMARRFRRTMREFLRVQQEVAEYYYQADARKCAANAKKFEHEQATQRQRDEKLDEREQRRIEKATGARAHTRSTTSRDRPHIAQFDNESAMLPKADYRRYRLMPEPPPIPSFLADR